MSQCLYGCRPGCAVCEEGKKLFKEGMYLQSLFLSGMSLPLSYEQERLLDRFQELGDLWLKHIGCYVPDRLS
jgi:hypothetical protein